jgi:DivIVA domain-containing protein
MPRLTARDIHSKEFRRSVRGYDMDEVNDFLDQIIKDYIEFENMMKHQTSLNENEQLNQIEHLLEQLLYDVQQLREENRSLREQLGLSMPQPPYPSQPFYR